MASTKSVEVGQFHTLRGISALDNTFIMDENGRF